MPATFSSPSAYNGFVPRATGQVISYIRNPDKFKLNKYVQYIESPETLGLYARIDRDQQARVVDSDHIFADGADRPVGDWNKLRFRWEQFRCLRRNYGTRIGDLAIKMGQNSWKVEEQHTGFLAHQAVINRTNRCIKLAENPANWGTHADTATSLNGGRGKWDLASDQPGTPYYNAIFESLMAACEKVNQDTNAVVEPSDLVLVICPTTARKAAASPEIHNYIKFGPFSESQLKDSNNRNMMWGLPPSLYGFELVIEDAVIVTDRPDAAGQDGTGSRAYVKDPTSALLLSRKGGIDGVYGAPSFSTFQLFWHEWQMAVERFADPENKRTNMNVVDMFAEVLAAPEAGFLIQGVL